MDLDPVGREVGELAFDQQRCAAQDQRQPDGDDPLHEPAAELAPHQVAELIHEPAGTGQDDTLGIQLGISFQQVQKYEKGRNRIGGGRLYKIARVLGVKITYFFDGVEHLLDADAVPAGTTELGAFDNRTIRAAYTLANLLDEGIKEQVFRLIAALPKHKASG